MPASLLHFSFAAALAAVPAVGQRLAQAINDPPWLPSAYFLTGGASYGFSLQLLGGANVSALEVHLDTLSQWDQLDIAIWDVDPVTSQPGNLLASASFTVYGPSQGFRGAAFAQPVWLPGMTPFFVSISPGGGGVALTTSGPALVPLSFSFNGNPWTTLTTIGQPSLRFYEGLHTGAATNFGVGIPGSLSAVPWLSHSGWPTTGNSLAIQLTAVPPSTGCLFVLGTQASTPLPFGTLYVQPIATLFALSSSSGAFGGAEMQLSIPYSAAFSGFTFAAQAFVADPGASQGVSHSQGIAFVVGH